MRLTRLVAAALTSGLALAGSVASAAPTTAPLGPLKVDDQAVTSVEAVHYRCWYRHGHRHCGRYVAAPVFSFYVGPRRHYRHFYRGW
jgi:hypothetical protein